MTVIKHHHHHQRWKVTITTYDDDDDDDVYLDRITQHKPKNYLPYVKHRPARKGISMKKNEQYDRCNKMTKQNRNSF
jgi:hypothetical protein